MNSVPVSSPIVNAEWETRIDALLAQMTIEEKAGQLNQAGLGDFESYISGPTGLGHVVLQHYGGVSARQAVERANELQRMAANTRLGIPLLIGADGILDARVLEATTFPQLISQGSTWNPALIEQLYAVLGREMRALGYGRTFAPDLGVARDPRFGRTGETFSEDTWFNARMGAAAVRGLQGEGVMATVKHFAAYNDTVGGRDSAAMDVSERALREVYLPPFRAAVDEGVGAVMCAYHAVNGVPCVSNDTLLTHILREEWGFEGMVVTDFINIERLHHGQRCTHTFGEAIAMAYTAGVDIHDHDSGEDFAAQLAELVRSGALEETVLDRSVRRVLRAKFRLGLFDRVHSDPEHAVATVGCAEHREVARQIARESLVLLKNDRDLLPFSKDLRKLAVIGPNADALRHQLGVWVKDVPPQWESLHVTVLEGLRRLIGEHVQIEYAQGCPVNRIYQTVAPNAVTIDGTTPGLRVAFFPNGGFEMPPALERTDLEPAFDWSKENPVASAPNKGFAVRWSGLLRAPASGLYRFSPSAGMGVRIWVGGIPVIDAWDWKDGPALGFLELTAERAYELLVEYRCFDNAPKFSLTIEHEIPARDGIPEAVALARDADAVVLVLGDSPDLNGEMHDRADLALTGHQEELARAVLETDTPTAIVLVNARPLTIERLVSEASAVLEAWNPGEEGGTAVAEALFGDYTPGGKLTMTWPRSVGQLPVYYNQEPGWHGGAYACGTPSAPLFPFGYGLSYTRFAYTALRCSKETLRPGESIEVTVDVTNTGTRRGDEVVQLYIRDEVATVVRPVKELRGFQRITLTPGETRHVVFTLGPDDFAFYNRAMQRVLEPGVFEIMVGGDSIHVLRTFVRLHG